MSRTRGPKKITLTADLCTDPKFWLISGEDARALVALACQYAGGDLPDVAEIAALLRCSRDKALNVLRGLVKCGFIEPGSAEPKLRVSSRFFARYDSSTDRRDRKQKRLHVLKADDERSNDHQSSALMSAQKAPDSSPMEQPNSAPLSSPEKEVSQTLQEKLTPSLPISDASHRPAQQQITSISDQDFIFDFGRPLLEQSGVSTPAAGSFLGRCRKHFSDAATAEAIRKAIQNRASDPKGFIWRILSSNATKGSYNGQKSNEGQRGLSARDKAIAARQAFDEGFASSGD